MRHREIRGDLARALDEEGEPRTASALVLGATSPELRAELDASPWARVRRVDLLRELGRHEALGAFALSLALGLLAEGELEDALIVSGSPVLFYLTRLEAARGGRT